MNKYSAFFFLLMITLPLFGKEVPIPGPGYVVSKSLVYNYIIGAAKVEFFKNGRYRITNNSGGWFWYNEGRCVFKDGKIRLHPEKCQDFENGKPVDCSETMGEAVCTLHEFENSWDYTHALKVTSQKKRSVLTQDPRGGPNYIRFNIEESRLKEGAKRTVDGVRVVILGSRTGFTTADVILRKKPSLDGPGIKYQPEYESGQEPSEFVPKDTALIIIARTEKKTKVKNRDDYWYLVKVGSHEGVWMYGDFVKMK